ncbi:MAG: CPBP family glutamic-type intramembrane protease [Terracidiphilus sp.]
MPQAIETAPEVRVEPNAQSAIEARVARGCIPWAAPLIVMVARPLLMIVAQGLTALILAGLHRPDAWHEAGHWWTIYGTLVDIGCLAAMFWFTRREGIRLRDLFGPVRLRYGKDIFLGLGYFALVFPLFLIGGMAFHKLLYGASTADAGAYLVQPHAMPVWAVVYSLSLWWIIWSPTEEATYQAFALPRMRALTGRTWLAFVVVGFVWAFQHSLLPFVLDWRFILFRTLAFAPGVFAMMAIYWRTRRLAPLIVAHWPMDIAGALMTCVLPNLK